ncbi:MAG: exodeoxyribonuclease V subunit gamma [Nitrospinota bacterium]|nr:exodeoxyribonuclease V subunit gamma [Nitrospinota bacterium]
MTYTNSLTLYPTAQRLAHAIDLMVNVKGGCALLAPGMMTMQAFERRLYGDLVGVYKPAGQFTRSIILSRVMTAHFGNKGSIPDASGGMSGAEKFPGFLDAMLGLFEQLGAGLVSPGEYEQIVGFAPSKEGDIGRLYAAYEKELLRHGVVDPAMARRQLVDALKQNAPIPFLEKYREIQLEDIYQFTPYRFELFRSIARRIPVRIVAPAPDSRREAFGFLTDNLAKFEELGSRAEKLEIEFDLDPEGPLADVKNRIFEMDPERQAENPQESPVAIIAGSSRYREMEEVGHALLSLKREKGYAWRDFIIVMRDIRPYAAIVEDVFRRYRIPFAMVKGVPLTQAPLAKAALSIFVAVDSGYAREDVLWIISSSYFMKFEKLDADEARRLYIGAGLISGPPSEWKSRMKAAIDRLEQKERPPAMEIASVTVELLEKLERLKTSGAPMEFMDRYTSLLRWLGLGIPAWTNEPADSHHLFRDSHSLSLLMDIIDEAAEDTKSIGQAGGRVGYGRMRDILVKSLDSSSLPEPGSADMNRAQILNVFDAVGVGAKVVFICGLHEGEFPQGGRAGAILTDMEKERFNKLHFQALIARIPELRKGRKVFDSPSDKWMEESLLFFQAIRAAEERLYLSYSIQELDGSPLMRSLFVDDMLDTLFPAMEMGERENKITKGPSLAIARPPDQLDDPEEARMKLLRDLFAEQGEPGELEERVAAVAGDAGEWNRFLRLVSLSSMERGRDSYFAAMDKEQKAILGGVYSGALIAAAPLVRQIVVVRREGRYSPTALEAYGQCPYRYFAGRILGLDPEKTPDLQLEASETGSMVHQILENFYHHLIERKKLPITNTASERTILHKEAEKVFANWRKDGMLPEEAVWAPEMERIMAMLNRWLEAEAWDQGKSGFTPAAVELAFEFSWRKKTAHEPFMLMVECGGVRYFTGSIDRLDVNQKDAAIRIVDYKLGANAGKYKEMLKPANMGKRSFQPPIYALLGRKWALENGLMKDIKNVAASYRLLSVVEPGDAYVTAGFGGGKNRTEFMDGKFLGAGDGAESTEGTFENLATGMMGRLENGNFQVDPLDCDYCNFPGLCRYIAAPRGEGGED